MFRHLQLRALSILDTTVASASSRLDSHAAASCSSMASAMLCTNRCFASAAASPLSTAQATSAAAARQPLSSEQEGHLEALMYLAQRPGQTVNRLATLTALAASFRDLSIALETLYKREQLKKNPLLSDMSDITPRAPPVPMPAADGINPSATAIEGNANTSSQAAALGGSLENSSLSIATPRPPHVIGMQYPIKDVTLLPDSITPSGLQLDSKYMDKISCWMQLLPSHMEVSYQLLSGMQLWPPMEASYPTYVDFDAAMRLLDHHRSHKRVKFMRKMLAKQDKYQMKTWEHYSGEA